MTDEEIANHFMCLLTGHGTEEDKCHCVQCQGGRKLLAKTIRKARNEVLEEVAGVAEKVGYRGTELHDEIGGTKVGWGLAAGQAITGHMIADAIRSLKKKGGGK